MRRSDPRYAGLVGLALVLGAADARAHHPIPPGPGAQVPRSRLGLEVEVAEFAVGGGGFWRRTGLTLEQAFFERLSLFAQIPLAQVSSTDGRDAFGPADVQLGTRGLVFATHDAMFASVLGVAVELPTGNVDEGLGGGHFMATPMVTLLLRPHLETLLSFTASDHVSLGDTDHAHDVASPPSTTQHGGAPDDHEPEPDPEPEAAAATDTESENHPHGSVLSPHSPHEMRVRLGVSQSWRQFFVTAGAETVVMFEEPDPLGPVTLDFGVGMFPSDRFRLALVYGVPVAGQRRLDWSGRLGLDYFF